MKPRWGEDHTTYDTEIVGFEPSIASKKELGADGGIGSTKISTLKEDANYVTDYPDPEKRKNVIISIEENIRLISKNKQPEIFEV